MTCPYEVFGNHTASKATSGRRPTCAISVHYLIIESYALISYRSIAWMRTSFICN